MNLGTFIQGKWLKAWLSNAVADQYNLDRYRRQLPNASIAPNCRISGPVSLGDGVSIRSGVKIDGNVSTERATYLNGPAQLRAGSERIEIGAFCSFAGGLTMVCTNHPTSHPSTYHIRAGKFSDVFRDVEGDSSPICVGSDVWVVQNRTLASPQFLPAIGSC